MGRLATEQFDFKCSTTSSGHILLTKLELLSVESFADVAI